MAHRGDKGTPDLHNLLGKRPAYLYCFYRHVPLCFRSRFTFRAVGGFSLYSSIIQV
uniref:Uncharacterized protein n=1 Tax=Arundo donax TaxID=35708 RepID=A0A0A9HV25_ARUDO